MAIHPKILFTSPAGSYDKYPVETDPIDYFYYRNTLKQKVFQLKSLQGWHSLHLIAQNISAESVVLENPSFRCFQEEVRSGRYDIVAIGFTMLLTDKVIRMAEWLRQEAPSVIIVAGGYGTAIFREELEIAARLKKLTDYICEGEGIVFFRQLIQERYGIVCDAPLRQSLHPARNYLFRTRIPLFRQIIVAGGLGCENGCPFCATSSQFNKCYISLFSGGELVKQLEEQHKKYPKITSAIIYEEDFLGNSSKVESFMEHWNNSALKKSHLMLTVFSSVRSIRQYTLEQLIACGIGTLFIGVESFSDDVIREEKLTKREGDTVTLFRELHANGINTLGSLVIGWDTQETERLLADMKGFVAINPTFYQVVPLHLVPGTRLWERMKEEKRVGKDYTPVNDSIADFNFEPRHYSRHEALNYISQTYQGLVDEGGPWPFRMFENALNGYKNLLPMQDESLQHRSSIYRKMLFPLALLSLSASFMFFGKNFRKRFHKTIRHYARHSPTGFVAAALISPFLTTALFSTYLYALLKHQLMRKAEQAPRQRTAYLLKKE